MRWERLFDDLAAQADALDRADLDAEVAERSRMEFGRVHLHDRLRAAVGWELRLTCRGAGTVSGRLGRVGGGWLLVHEPLNREVLVATAAVTSVTGLPLHSAPIERNAARARIETGLDLRHALRAVGRDRSGTRLTLVDATVLAGTIDRVGADYVELAEHPPGEARRAAAVREVRTVPLSAVATVRTQGEA